MKVLVTTKTRLYRKCTRFFCQETWNYQIIKISIYAPHIPFTLRQAQYHKAQKYNLAENINVGVNRRHTVSQKSCLATVP